HALAIVGDEQQVALLPLRLFSGGGRRTFAENYAGEDPAQCDHRELLRLEPDKEDAPGLARAERTQALDLIDLGGVGSVDTRLFKNLLARVVDEVPPRGARLLSELAHFSIEGRECVTEEDTAHARVIMLSTAEDRPG